MASLYVPASPVNPEAAACLCGDGLALCPHCRAMAEAAPAGLRTPCPDCGNPLWRYLDPEDGEETFYCIDCTLFTIAQAGEGGPGDAA